MGEVKPKTLDKSFKEKPLRVSPGLQPELLLLDDFGLKSLHPPAPEDLSDVTNERYERGSIMLASNRTPEGWPDLCGNLC